MNELTITAPDDWHLHFRDGDMLKETVPATSRCFKRAIVMPNLTPPIINAKMALSYQQRIINCIPTHHNFTPLMTIYLTNDTSKEDILTAKKAGIVAAKLYPAGATTNSDSAVTSLSALFPILETMSEVGMLLLIHGEVTLESVDIFDREKYFIDQHLSIIVDQFKSLKIVFEHITTSEAVDFVTAANCMVAATITPQHLLLNRNDLLVGGVRPHNFCLPVLKRNTHQEALQAVVKTGSNKFFLGTDSAPHEQSRKESSCGCAGCYSAWSAIELYAQIFDDLNALDKLEGFASHHGPDFYDLQRNTNTITLERKSWKIPNSITLPNGNPIVPFYAGKQISWKLK